MSRGPSSFKQRDVAKAIKAVASTGQQIKAIEITKDGSIKITIGEPDKQSSNEWDSVLKWRASG